MPAVFPADYPSDVDDLPIDRQVSQLRIPPHSIEAESSVLGGLLLDNGAWDRVGDLLIDSEDASPNISRTAPTLIPRLSVVRTFGTTRGVD